MKESLLKFRIGNLAQHLNVKRFVIRFWEKEFDISSQRSPGGQRYYSSQDYEKFKLIKELLYGKGYTIAGAKKIINSNFFNKNNTLKKTTSFSITSNKQEEISQQIITLHKQLIKLRELL